MPHNNMWKRAQAYANRRQFRVYVVYIHETDVYEIATPRDMACGAFNSEEVIFTVDPQQQP